MASDSSSGFWQGYHTFLYGQIKYNREGGRKRINEQTRTWVSSKRKKGCFVTLCILRPSADYRRRVFCAKHSTKATKNTNSSLTVFPNCLLLLTVLPMDCYLTPTGFFCSPFSIASLRLPLSTASLSLLSDLPFLLHFRSRGRRHPQSFV